MDRLDEIIKSHDGFHCEGIKINGQTLRTKEAFPYVIINVKRSGENIIYCDEYDILSGRCKFNIISSEENDVETYPYCKYDKSGFERNGL